MQGIPVQTFQGFSAPPPQFGSTPRFPGRALGHLVPHTAPRCRGARFPAVHPCRASMLCAHRGDRPCPVPRDRTCPVRPCPVSGGVDRLVTPESTLASLYSILYKSLALHFILSTRLHQQPSVAGMAHSDRTVILCGLLSLSSSGFPASSPRGSTCAGTCPLHSEPWLFQALFKQAAALKHS